MQLKNSATNSRLSWIDGKLEIAGSLKQLRGHNDLYQVGFELHMDNMLGGGSVKCSVTAKGDIRDIRET